MSDEQTVVDKTDALATPATEGKDAQNDVDALLSEYANSGESKDTPITDAKADKKDKPEEINTRLVQELDYLKKDREAKIQEQAAKQFDSTVKSIKGDIDIPDKIVKAFLNQEAVDRPGLKEAYLDRDRNPQKWAKIEKALQSDLRELVKALPSKEATATANQVASAVLNAKTQAPVNGPQSPKDLRKMSNADFERFVNS